MKKKFGLLIITVLLITGSLSADILQKATAVLNIAFREINRTEEVLPVIIVMEEQYDPDILYKEIQGLDKISRRNYTIKALEQFSNATQSGIRKVLTDMEKEGLVTNLRYLWVANVINLEATKEALLILDSRDDIDRLEYDPLRKILNDDDFYPAGITENNTDDPLRNDREIVYNLNVMNVPDVWDQGFTGQGVTVAVLDTGVNYNHNDITNQMWTHPDYPNHGFNFINNSHQTMDNHSHGTHCAGTVAGDGTSGSQTGVAPGSTVMALLVLDSSGSGQQSGVWAAIQFSMQHGADVMSLSLGWLHAWDPDRTTWRMVMSNALSAGVVASVAAGNEGNQQYSYPIPSNVRTPGDCPPPWLHPNQTEIGGLSAVISVGATDSSDQIANFSSRGPVTWQNVGFYNDYLYSPGIGLIRPDIVAPGVSVKSLVHNNNFGYTLKSGTSMAAPNNAGVIALMISKDPTLLPEEISQIIEQSAVPLSPFKNNTFGSGRVDALAAIDMVTADNPPNPAMNPIPSDLAVNVSLYPSLSWSNGGGSSMYYVYLGTDNPPTNIVDGYITEELSYLVPEQLDSSTEYFWRIDSMNSNGVTTGNIWSFTTGLPVSEDFETGDFSNYSWQFSTAGDDAQNWQITNEESFSGYYSARSGEIGDSCITTLYITLEVVEPGIISFYRKVSTENNLDFLRFFINNTIVGHWSGEQDWGFESFDVSPGTYTFRWLYMKDSANSDGEDTVWIDDITFPPLTHQVISPDNLSYDLQLEEIHLSWDLPEDNDEDQYDLLGFNIYQALDQQASYSMVNSVPVEENEYYILITESGEHHYYITALYDVGESEPSESIALTIEPAPADPDIYPPGGEYDHVVTVHIETDDPDIFIYYTTDNSDPTTGCSLYTEPILIETDMTLKVKLFQEGHLPGDVIINEYTFTTSTEEDFVGILTDLRVYPNPFMLNNPALRNNQHLSIDFIIADKSGEVQIEIFNIKGQLVRSFRQQVTAGQRQILPWDLNSSQGKQAGSGVYLIRLNSGEEVINRRVMIIK
jgi:subtilisin family serine protease